MDPAVDRRVLRRGLEVLTDRDDVDLVASEIAHRLDHLVVRLAEPDDDPGLRQDRIVGHLLGVPKELESPVVARLSTAHRRMQTANGLDVVVEDLGALGEDHAQRVLFAAEEVGGEHFDRGFGKLTFERPDRGCEVTGTAVA